MTREEQKAYNAENYPASVVTWLNEATDRAYNTFEIIRTCQYCKHYKEDIDNNADGYCSIITHVTTLEAVEDGAFISVDKGHGCNNWEAKDGK